MRSFNHILTAALLVTLTMSACTKKTAFTGDFAYGQLQVELAALPSTPSMKMYFNEDSITLLDPGSKALTKGQTADQKRLTLYKTGTDIILVDTMIQLARNTTTYLKFAYSDALDMHGFLSGNSFVVHPDSCRFKLFNSLTTELQPEGVEIDAILCQMDDNGNYPYTGITFENFTRNKLHPMEVTVKAASNYVLRFRNRATGEFLKDFLRDYALISFAGGSYFIISAITRISRNKPTLATESAQL